MAMQLNRRHLLAGAAGLAATAGLGSTGFAQAAKVRIATLPSIILFPTWVARDLGIFKEYGVEVEFVIARGGSEITQLLLTGAADIANAGVEHMLKLRETGLDVKVIAVQERRYITELVVHTKHKDKVKSVKDLKGMTIGVSGMGSGSHVSSRYVLRAAGLDPDTDVSFVAVGSPATQVKAFTEGQIDVLMAFDPAQSILKYEKKIAYPVWSGPAGDPPAIFQDFAMECLAAKAAWIDKNLETAKAINRANTKAIDVILEGDPRVLEVYQAMFPGVAKDVLRRSLNEHLASFSPVMSAQSLANVVEYGKFAGVTTKSFTLAEVVPAGFEDLWRTWKAPPAKGF
ncbi:ABC transporter substrate-binding protein [Xanthobacter sp. KR7-225]|uniref:ABC transporter substrate-binding protein n=1 Tax=Xanthobacter sp. KR7-225 TaxID=3156613 RepID=UPI0032B4B96F